MTSKPRETPSIRRLKLLGGGAIALALAVGAGGLVARAYTLHKTALWTNAQAAPTVALARLDHEAAGDLTLPGAVQPFQIAQIYARVNGYLKSWRQDIGSPVKAGQVLASIDTPDLDQQLGQAQGDLAVAAANQRLAALTAKRWSALVSSQAVSQQAADEKVGDDAAKTAMVAAALANVRRLKALESFKRVVAPFDGIVTARKTDVGALINAGPMGQELFEVADLHRLRIYVEAPQTLSAKLQVGQTASFEVPQFPGRTFAASVVAVSHALDPSSRSMKVELQADNPGGVLAAGSYCQVHFQAPVDAATVRIPATALVVVDHGAQVAVLSGNGKAVLKPVKLGRDFGDSVEVVAGLAPTDRVIDSPPETLRSGDAVQVASRAPNHGGR